MSNPTEEQISSFLDDELPAGELDLLLVRLDRDRQLRGRVARYAMIGDCLRGASMTPGALDLAEKVRSALLAEEAQLPAGMPRHDRRAWRGWMTGAAAAAAVLVAVLIAGPIGLRRAITLPPVSGVASVPRTEQSLEIVTVPARYRLDPHSAARLTGYLMAHGRYASQIARSAYDSRLLAAQAERIAWERVQDHGDGP